MKDMKLLEQLSNADGLASCEQEIRDILYANMKDFADDVYTDNIGSIIFEKKSSKKGPKIMICSHIDEVGFKVRSITEEGKIIVKQIGHVMNLSKFNQRVRITNAKGKKIVGILNSTYNEKQDSKEIPGISYVDIGASSAKEVEALEISVGNMVCFDTKFTKMAQKGSYLGKAFDDRIGCYILTQLIKKFKGKKHPNDLYFVGTSSEEVGVRGAGTSAAKVNPDIALIVDTTIYPDELSKVDKSPVKNGRGVNFTFSDAGLETNQVLLDFIINRTKALNKKFQWDQFDGGATDAMRIHLHEAGVPSFAFCVPIRYIHGPFSIVDKKDIDDTIDIIADVLTHFQQKTYDKITKFI